MLLKKDRGSCLMFMHAIRVYMSGCDHEEVLVFERQARELKAEEAWRWGMDFAAEHSAGLDEAACEELQRMGADLDEETRLSLVVEAWRQGMQKGYLKNEEAEWLLKVGVCWKLEDRFFGRLNHA